MPTASAIRQTIEAALAERIHSALTPAPRILRPVSSTGIRAVDEVLSGGIPVGAITEMVGPECSGRTGLALSFLAQITAAAKVCAWVDVSDCLQPESAAANGVDLSRLLWVRCVRKPVISAKPRARIEQGLRVTDLLLQVGGFSAIVLDMGSIAPEHASRVPLATWFRYRAAAEQSQASILLMTQHACAKSSAGLVLRFEAGSAPCDERTVFTGSRYSVAVERERFAPASTNVVPMRKPPQSARAAEWRNRAAWAGAR